MSDDLVKQSLLELQDLVRCRCHEAYKGRGLRDPDCHCDCADAVAVVVDRIERLEELLKAAQDDAKEAEAYAGEMESVLESIKAKLVICEKYRDAYAECDRIGTQAVRDLEAKLAKAVEALEMADQAIMDNTTDQDLLMWGEPTVGHIRTTLAELTGQDDE